MIKVSVDEFLNLKQSETNLDCSKYGIIGKSKLREYKIWKAIKNRTTNPNRVDANHYFNKGIKCSDEWFNSFEQFLWDMGLSPSSSHSIDRINNDLGYSKDNCRWATQKEQCSNRGEFNLVFTYNGESKVLKAWADFFGIKYGTLYTRIQRDGMSFEEAINHSHIIPFTLNNETKSLKEWCEFYNMEYEIVYNRIHKHKWSLEEALTIPKGGRRNKK